MGKMERRNLRIAGRVKLCSFVPLDMTDLTPVQRLSLRNSRNKSEISPR